MSPFISCYCFQLSACLTPGLPWKMRVDFWQLAVLFIFFDQFCNWPMKLSLKFPCISATSCATSKTTHYTGAEFNREPLQFKHHRHVSLFSFCRGAALQKERNSEWWAGECGDSFPSSVCVHHVSWPLLAFMFCLAEFPAPAVSVSLLKIGVPQRQETLPPLHPFQLSSA